MLLVVLRCRVRNVTLKWTCYESHDLDLYNTYNEDPFFFFLTMLHSWKCTLRSDDNCHKNSDCLVILILNTFEGLGARIRQTNVRKVMCGRELDRFLAKEVAHTDR